MVSGAGWGWGGGGRPEIGGWMGLGRFGLGGLGTASGTRFGGLLGSSFDLVQST